jgi:hypothetical protein
MQLCNRTNFAPGIQINNSHHIKKKSMERNKQVQIGLMALLAILLAVNLYNGTLNGLFGKSDAKDIREAAVTTQGGTMQGNGNIPGTNVTATGMPTGASDVPQGPTTTIQYGSVGLRLRHH